jgi:hypothetical protein
MEIGFELQIGDTEARAELVHVEEGRLLFINAPQAIMTSASARRKPFAIDWAI